MSSRLEGKIALVTGGSSGIGLATAQRFAKEGAYVYITGRRQPELDEVVKTIGPRVKAVRADASILADLVELFAQIKQEQGRLDILFANAGGGSFAPIGSITEDNMTKPSTLMLKVCFSPSKKRSRSFRMVARSS
jgi:NAD(P)-dependent dehydrogenase (short-subunit alcohol dehydrogenase family)